ncbi:hypothetical protein ATANTOWER_032339 [Ataeniobius toweri]|uniref:Uncharacterized protein n=1 Tax=Ataeniobius toweri TaxID=208326 RepID=A0ABU7A3B9_9TELE|nr:hypothetical protein [Ataeniobius toweri]
MLTATQHKTSSFVLSHPPSHTGRAKPVAPLPPHNFNSAEWATCLSSGTYKHRSVKEEYQTEPVCVQPPSPQLPTMIQSRGPSYTKQKE